MKQQYTMPFRMTKLFIQNNYSILQQDTVPLKMSK